MENFKNSLEEKILNTKEEILHMLVEEFEINMENFRNSFIENNLSDLNKYYRNINFLNTVRNNITSKLNIDLIISSTDLEEIYSKDFSQDDDYNTIDESEDESEDSGTMIGMRTLESVNSIYERLYNPVTINAKPSINTNKYWENISEDYAEIENKLSLIFNLIPIDKYSLYPSRINGIKLFNTIFQGNSINSSMLKMFALLFQLSEDSFISLANNPSVEYFSNKINNNFKSPIELKENVCYFESDVDDRKSSEMIKLVLKELNIDLNACKILRNVYSNKINEENITIVY